jgi:hypothetical protein
MFLSLSVPHLTSLAPTSTFTSHRLGFLERRHLSVSVSSTSSGPSLVASFQPSRLSRRFQLAAGADSPELDDEFEEVEQGVAEEESESGPVEVFVL